jgi:hypothetical protein
VWWAARFASFGHRCLLVTIDWDLPIMLLLWNMPDVIVKISRVFVKNTVSDVFQYSSEDVMLTKQKALSTFGTRYQPASELVNISKTQASVGGIADTLRMHHYVFMILCGASCDYNVSLNGFFTPKFTEQMLDFFCLHPEKVSFLSLGTADGAPFRRTLTFYPIEFVNYIRKSGMPKVRNDSLEEFTEEIHSILYCIRYFAGWDAGRTPAGGPSLPSIFSDTPDHADVSLFGTEGTVSSLLDGKKKDFPVYRMVEEFPLDALAELPFPPEMLFSQDHTDMVKRGVSLAP